MRQIAQLIVRSAVLVGVTLIAALPPAAASDGLQGTPFPILSVEPSIVDFGSVVAGGPPSCQTLIASNTGGTSLIIEDLILDGPIFQIQSSTCIDAVLTPGQSCATSICFSPGSGELGPYDDELVYLGSFDSVVVPLSGLAAQAQAPSQLVVSPSAIGFGERPVGAPAVCQNVVVSNASPELASGTLSVNISGNADFSISADACSGGSLPPGGSCIVTACFAPVAAGAGSADIAVSAPEDGASVALFGTGVEVAAPGELLLNPPTADFGSRLIGTSPTTVTFSLSAQDLPPTAELTLSGILIEGSPAFSLAGGSCAPGLSLSISQPSCSIVVRFAPTDIGSVVAVLEARTAQGINAEAALEGIGVILDQQRLDDLIVFRGATGQEWVGTSMDFVHGLRLDDRTDFLFGASGGAAGNQGAAWLIPDVLIGLGSFAIQPPILADIAAADGRFGVRILPEPAALNDCHFGTQGFGWSVAGIDRRSGQVGSALIAIGAPGWSGIGETTPESSRGAVFVLSGPPPADLGSVPVNAWFTSEPGAAQRGFRVVNSGSSGPCLGSGLRALGNIDGSGRSALAFQDLPMTIDAAHHSTFILLRPESLLDGGDIDVDSGHSSLIRIVVPFNEGAYLPTMSTVAPLGDFNGNGFDDFVIAAPNARLFSSDTGSWHAGAVFVIYGDGQAPPPELVIPSQVSATGLGERVLAVFGPRIQDDESDGVIGIDLPRFGTSVDGAGDFNGNGLADLIIGVGEAGARSGSVLVLAGGQYESPLFSDELDAGQALRITSSDSSDHRFAESVRGAGDVSGNGLADILIGSPWANLIGHDGSEATGAGRVYLISGQQVLAPPGPPPPAALDVASASPRIRSYSLADRLPGAFLAGSRFGLMLASPSVDMTGNQTVDFAVSAPQGLAANGQTVGGWAIVVEGEADPSSLTLTALPGPAFGFPGQRVLQLAISNSGQARANELALSLVLGSASRQISTALAQAQTCSLDAGRALRCANLGDQLWDCQLSPGEASCQLPSLAIDQTAMLLFALEGPEPEDISAELSAANAGAVQIQFEAAD